MRCHMSVLLSYQKSGADVPAGHNVIQHLRASAPLAMTISQPASVAICAACSLVTMPPVPRLGALAAGKRENALVDDRAPVSMSRASGFLCGSLSYSPSMSESRTSRSAPMVARHDGRERVVVADCTPISSVDTVSFSLMTGSAPSSSSRASVLWQFACGCAAHCRCPSPVMQDLRHDVVVLREELVVDIHQLALADGGCRLLGRHVRRTWPADLSLPTPMPMAPEETRMIS